MMFLLQIICVLLCTFPNDCIIVSVDQSRQVWVFFCHFQNQGKDSLTQGIQEHWLKCLNYAIQIPLLFDKDREWMGLVLGVWIYG